MYWTTSGPVTETTAIDSCDRFWRAVDNWLGADTLVIGGSRLNRSANIDNSGGSHCQIVLPTCFDIPDCIGERLARLTHDSAMAKYISARYKYIAGARSCTRRTR